MARGFYQKVGVDYEKTFSHIAKYTSIRFITSLETLLDYILYQMDVKTTILDGLILEEISINQEKRFYVHGCETHV